MAVLHLVSRSPGESLALMQCLARVGAGDVLVLLESGVYAALRNSVYAANLKLAIADSTAVYAVAADLMARGIDETELAAGIEPIDYAGLVELSIIHTPAISWY